MMRGAVTRLWLLVLAATAMVDGVQYAGTNCAGIIDFDLVAPMVPELEMKVAAGMSELFSNTPWVEQSCAASLRTRACMLGYTTAGGTGLASDGQKYCKKSCEEQLAICSTYNEMIGADPLALFGLSCDMATDDAGCHPGGESQVAEEDPVCPRPLVVPNSASSDRDAHIEWIDGTACALPCPNTLSFDADDWDAFNIVTLTTTAFALVCSIIACVTHYLSKNWNIVYLTAGLTVSSFTMMIYFIVDYNYKVSCSGNAGHVEHDPFCMFVAAVLIYFCLWFSEWALLLAANLYLGIVMGWKKAQLEQMRRKALYYIVFAPFLSWVIPMAAGNLGNEWTGANVKTCIYMTTTDNEYYFWSLAWGPLFAYMVIAFTLSVCTIYTVTKHTTTMVRTEQHSTDDASSAARKLRKFWKYNSRQVAFMFVFICTTVVTLAGWMEAHVSSGTRTGEIEDFVACLLSNSSPDPDHARSICNQPESSDYWNTQLVLCYVGAFGAFPLFVFGTGSFFKKKQEAHTTKSHDSSVESSAFKRITLKIFKQSSTSTLKAQPSENFHSINTSAADHEPKPSVL